MARNYYYSIITGITIQLHNYFAYCSDGDVYYLRACSES